MCVDIFGDNEDAMVIVNDASSSLRSKHVDMKFHFIQRLVCAGETQILHVGTINMRIFLRIHSGVRSSWCTARR